MAMVSAGPVTSIKMPQSIERPAVTRPGQLFTLLNSAKQILRCINLAASHFGPATSRRQR